MASKHSQARIFIIGAGIGGLSAAIALRQKGHYVEIFEASHFNDEIGAGIALPPNAVKIMKDLCCDFGKLDCVPYEGVVIFSFDGKDGPPQTMNRIKERFGEDWLLSHRVDLHTALKCLALSDSETEGYGPPATLHLGRKLVDCDPTSGVITFDDGVTRQADLIIGADGIHSTCRSIVVGKAAKAPPSGIAAFRWMVDAADIRNYTELNWVTAGPSGPRIVAASDSRALFLYPCRGGTLFNCLAIHDDLRNQDESGWNEPASQDEVMKTFADFHPQFKLFLSLAKGIRLWQMRCVPVLDSWFRGKVTLLGDAAHATLPTFGQGFALALEDAITLGVLFSTEAELRDIPTRLEMYQALRKKRAEFIAAQSRDQLVISEMRGLYYRSQDMQREIMGYEAHRVAQASMLELGV